MLKQPSYIKILIIDDFPPDVHSITRKLQSASISDFKKLEFDIHAAATGRDGLILAQELKPACILLDYGLPDMSGLEFIDSLIEVRGKLDIPIVMLTGQGDEKIAVRAMKRGVYEYLIKGNFGAEELIWTISGALDKAKLENQIESKHEELEMFAARMTHDILSPLSNIALYLEILEPYINDIVTLRPDNDVDMLGKDEQLFNTIAASVDHLIHMVQAFRTYAQIGRTEMQLTEVNLDSIVSHILMILSPQIEEAGAEIIVDPLPVVIGDNAGLGQLLQNLISNAIKFRGDKPRIEIGAVRRGSKWQISVSDNGIGIDNAGNIEDEIFEPFVRKQNYAKYSGSGIGLATCRKIVEQHHGEIWFSSEPNSGTTFYFTLEQDLDLSSAILPDHLIENLALLESRHIPDDIETAYERLARSYTSIVPHAALPLTTNTAVVSA